MTSIHKIDIAKDYLEDALHLYSIGRFLSALTLAGAAEEMLGKSIEHSAKTSTALISPITALAKEAEAISTFDKQLFSIGMKDFTAKSPAEINRDLLAPRNSAKHFNDVNEPIFNFDQKLEAGSMIIRAIKNYRIVFPKADDHFDCEEQDISVDQLNRLNLSFSQPSNFGNRYPTESKDEL